MATQQVTLHFSRFNSSNVTIINDTNPVGQDTTNDQLYAQILCDNTPGSESYGFWQLEGSSIPSDAYNISINNVQARCAVIGINDPNDIETYVQLYEDINTPNGDPSNNPFPIAPQGGNVPIDDPGTWTLSQIRTFYMKVCGNNHGGLAGVEIYVFGVDVEIEYETATPSPDYEIGSGAWYSKIGGSWKEIDKMYYKINNTWKEVTYAYRKQDGIWYSISKDVNPIIQADFTGSLAMTFALDNTTNNVTIVSNRGSITNNGLSLTGSSSVGAAYISIPTNTLAKLQTANQDLWFTAQMTPSAWANTWQSVIQCGFGSNTNNRNDNIYNFLQINGPWYTRPQDTDEILIPNNTTRWVKFKLCSNGQRIAHMYDPSTSSWVQKDPKNETSRALWNNSFSYMVFDQCTSGGNLLISYFKAWTREPTNTEIGI